MSYFRCATLNALLKMTACLARRTAKKTKGEPTVCMECKNWKKYQVGLIGDAAVEGPAQAALQALPTKVDMVKEGIRRSKITITRRSRSG